VPLESADGVRLVDRRLAAAAPRQRNGGRSARDCERDDGGCEDEERDRGAEAH
jgi:hypothetical protein